MATGRSIPQSGHGCSQGQFDTLGPLRTVTLQANIALKCAEADEKMTSKLFSILVIGILLPPESALADGHKKYSCALLVKLGDQYIAHQTPCETGSEISFEVQGFKLEYHLKESEALITLWPSNDIFFGGKNYQYTKTDPRADPVPFYDTESGFYVDGAGNRPTGTVKLVRTDR